MSDEIAFNRGVTDLVKRFPEDPAIKAIEKYRIKCKTSSYYIALDYLGLKIGIQYTCTQMDDEEERKPSLYYAGVQFLEGNPLNGKSRYEDLRYEPFKARSKCYTFLACQYVYTLMRVTDLEKYALGDGMVV